MTDFGDWDGRDETWSRMGRDGKGKLASAKRRSDGDFSKRDRAEVG